MPSPKIKTLDDLRDHINEHCDMRGLSSNFDTFMEMMMVDVSALSMAKIFQVNYRTILKWRKVYHSGKL